MLTLLSIWTLHLVCATKCDFFSRGTDVPLVRDGSPCQASLARCSGIMLVGPKGVWHICDRWIARRPGQCPCFHVLRQNFQMSTQVGIKVSMEGAEQKCADQCSSMCLKHLPTTCIYLFLIPEVQYVVVGSDIKYFSQISFKMINTLNVIPSVKRAKLPEKYLHFLIHNTLMNNLKIASPWRQGKSKWHAK